MKNKIKVYHLFWAVAIIVLLIGLILNDGTLDINVHDTYFIASYRDITVVLFLFFFLNGIGYWLVTKIFKKQLVRFLTSIHSFIVIGSFIIYWTVIAYYKYLVVKESFPLFYYKELENIILAFSAILIVFVAQPLYIINLLIGLFRKKSEI
jgi:heme/copper-type cytochrome/quinol oxidase subunit 1